MKKIIALTLLLFWGGVTSPAFSQDVANPYQANKTSNSADYYSDQGYQEGANATSNNVQAALGTIETVQSQGGANNQPAPYVGTLSAVHSLSDVIFAICRIVGLLFMLVSIFYFDKYRKKQGDVTMGQVLWTLIVGIAIFILPIIAQYADISKTISQVSTSQSNN